MERRHLPWLLSVLLILGGSVGAHVLGYELFGPEDHHVAGHTGEEITSGGGPLLLQLPWLVGALGALLAVGFACRLLVSRRAGGGASPAWFFLLPPVGLVLQELVERLAHVESAPFDPAHEPALLAILFLQLPFGLLAYLTGRLLLAVAKELSYLLRPPVPEARRTRRAFAPVSVARVTPRHPLALGHPQRAPPAIP